MVSPARVLVVDDSPTILKVVSAILARHGYEPSVARDGLAGIEMIKRGPKFDLVLLDFVMPRMNGYQFCRELRSNPAHRALPVVLMSAKGDKIRGQFVQQTGAVDAITKPFDARALVAVIEGALAKTAEGRARPVPEGAKMPDEDTIAESIRPSVGPRQQRMRVAIDVAQQIAHAVAPAVLALSPLEREVEAAILGAVARVITDDVIDALATTLRDLEGGEGAAKEIMGGDIAAIPLAEILQVLQMQRQTGVFRVSNARSAVTISLRQGLVDFVQSRGAAEEYRLGRYFVEKGLVTRSQLDQVIASKGPSGPLLGDVLVDSGQVSREDLNDALAKQSSELIYEILRWPYGRFSFTREPFRPEADAAKLGLGISGLVLEGYRRVDEWRLMEGTINFDQVIVLDQFSLESVSPQKLTRIDKLVLGAVDGTRTVNEIIKESAVSSFDAIKCLYQFLQSRVLRPRTA
jgi:CheY-like chemotaxis protein